tara:strand:- start:317 stop:592 length:276 start_codon:yes stop_codon:yes gene_type:complete
MGHDPPTSVRSLMPCQVLDKRLGRVITWPAILSQYEERIAGCKRAPGNILSHGNLCTAAGEETLRKGQLTLNLFGSNFETLASRLLQGQYW